MQPGQDRRRRDRAYEIAEALRVSGSTEYSAMREMIGILLEDAKTSLVTAEGNDMLRVQGEARAFDKLYRRLTDKPPQVQE